MSWEAFFRGIEDFFVNVAFAPLDYLRQLELESWVAANALNWIFLLIGFVAFGYWMKQLKEYNNNDTEDRSVVAHPFLGNKS
ncbi:DUF6341 family protein [Croceiramulus getboli]|nr:uracil phosphoribosyltransferase [Flavobacteriaceae bacterium YJPT1-3]